MTTNTTQSERKRWALPRRCAIGFLVAALFIVAMYGFYVGILQMTGNFHAVQEGVLYRSSQPTIEQLAAYKAKYNIQSIINLRGESPGNAWYEQERAESMKLGIAHFDFRMSATKELPLERAQELIALLNRVPKPVLIHCNHGADRSGLASALYLAAIAKEGESPSEAQMSFRFGHIAIPFLSSAFAMDETFEDLENWLGYTGS